MPTLAQKISDYNAGWKASRTGNEAEPKYSLDAFDAGFNDEQAGGKKFVSMCSCGGDYVESYHKDHGTVQMCDRCAKVAR